MEMSELLAKTDAALVTETLAGQKESFAELYDRYAGVVRAACWGKVGSE